MSSIEWPLDRAFAGGRSGSRLERTLKKHCLRLKLYPYCRLDFATGQESRFD